MSSVSLSTNFDFSIFMKIIFPGFISALIITYILFPLISDYTPFNEMSDKIIELEFLDKFIFILVVSVVSGVIISSYDVVIYRFYQGISPSWIWKWKHDNTTKRYQKVREDIKNLRILKKNSSYYENEKEKIHINNELSKLLDELEEYPVDGRIETTRLGNIIAEYESYAEEQYGMKYRIFISRLMSVLPNKITKDLRIKASKADSMLYSSFVLLIFSPVILFKVFTSRSVITTWLSIPVSYNIHFTLMFMLFITWLLYKIIKFFYDRSIEEHKFYGDDIKSIFDIYRGTLAQKLGFDITGMTIGEEKEDWNKKRRKFELYKD